MRTTMEFTSLFDEASRDVEAEGIERIRTSASIAAAESAWPFLALAQSEIEFGHRLAMVEDRLTAIASEHGLSFEEVAQPLREGFLAVLASREAGLDPKAAASLTCANCGHSNAAHSKGALCDCGCSSFEPRAKTAVKTASAHPDIAAMHDAAEGTKYHATVRPFKEDGSLASNGASVVVTKGSDGRWYQGTIDKRGRTPEEFHSALDDLDGSIQNGNRLVVTRRRMGGASFMDDSDLPDHLRSKDGILPGGRTAAVAGCSKCDPHNIMPPGSVTIQHRPDKLGRYDVNQINGPMSMHTVHQGYDLEEARLQAAKAHSEAVSRGQGSDDAHANGGHAHLYDYTRSMGVEAARNSNGHQFTQHSWGETCDNCGMDAPEPGEWTPSCSTVSSGFDGHMAALKRALQEGQNPLEWLEGDQPQATPTHHDEVEQFEGDPTPAIDKASAREDGHPFA